MKNFKEYVFLSIGVLFLSVSVFLSNSAKAQDKIFTIEEAVLGGGGKLIPKNELQKFENGYAFVSGLFASEMVGVMVACRQNNIKM